MMHLKQSKIKCYLRMFHRSYAPLLFVLADFHNFYSRFQLNLFQSFDNAEIMVILYLIQAATVVRSTWIMRYKLNSKWCWTLRRPTNAYGAILHPWLTKDFYLLFLYIFWTKMKSIVVQSTFSNCNDFSWIICYQFLHRFHIVNATI